MSYQVVAPLVLAKDPEGKVHERYADAIIQWLSPEQEKHLLELGFVVKVGDQLAPDDDEGEGEGDDAPEKPKQVAPKAVWVDYAANGAPEDERIAEDEAEALTKAELVERFN